MKTEKMNIDVDRKLLIDALSCANHNRIIFQRDYAIGKDQFREVVDVDGTGVYGGGKIKLTILREKVEPPPTESVETTAK